MKVDVDGVVESVRQLAVLANSAGGEWKPCLHKYDEDEEAELNVPDDDRQVIVFLNGHVDVHDTEGRGGGGWGICLGYFDHEKRYWRAGGHQNRGHATHWMDLPPAPDRSGEYPPIYGPSGSKGDS